MRLFVLSRVRICLRMTVATENSEVLDLVVGSVAVYVIELEWRW
jgi:hypothetical protein